MLVYWLLFIFPAILALLFPYSNRFRIEKRDFSPLFVFCFLALVVLIGLRHDVGGDWANYVRLVDETRWITLAEAVLKTDPGYGFLNWIAAHSSGGIYVVNTVCGLLFCFGLIVFCNQLPRPWLALAVAMPYLVLVVAMGYSRQGVAIGIAMWALALLQRGNLWRFVIVVSAAGLFHKSAVLLILIAFSSISKHKFFAAVGIMSIGAVTYVLLLADYVDMLVEGYLEAEYQSTGAGVRVAMNALPGLIFLFFHRRLELMPEQRRVWLYMAWGSLGFVALLAVSPSSTAVDRLALYLIPLQLFVWSQFPDLWGRPEHKNLLSVLLVLSYSFTILFVWLFFAEHRNAWLPYKFYLLTTL